MSHSALHQRAARALDRIFLIHRSRRTSELHKFVRKEIKRELVSLWDEIDTEETGDWRVIIDRIKARIDK